MGLQEGDKYQCQVCGAEVQVTKSGNVPNAQFGNAGFNQVEFNDPGNSALTCCGQEMQKA
jgi:Desulfoferrodoxin, N-terminal domain